MNGRIYDPLIGRFLSADVLVDGVTTVQGYNRYSYTKNNPMSHTDPSGYMAPAIPLILIGGELAVEGALGTAAALLMIHHLITEKPPEGGPMTNSITGTAPPMGGGGTDVLDPPQTSPEVLDTNDVEPRPLNGVDNPQGSPDPEGDPETKPVPVAPLIGSDTPNDDGEQYLYRRMNVDENGSWIASPESGAPNATQLGARTGASNPKHNDFPGVTNASDLVGPSSSNYMGPNGKPAGLSSSFDPNVFGRGAVLGRIRMSDLPEGLIPNPDGEPETPNADHVSILPADMEFGDAQQLYNSIPWEAVTP